MIEDDRARVSKKIGELVEPMAQQFVAGWGKIAEADFALALEARCDAMKSHMLDNGEIFGALDAEIQRAFREAAWRLWAIIPDAPTGRA